MLSKKIYPVTPPYLTQGDYSALFISILGIYTRREKIESSFAGFFNRSYALLMPSGRSAIKLLLLSLKLPSKSEVLLPAYSCIVVPDAVVSAGLIPKFVDIDKKTTNVTLAEYKKVYSNKCRVIILTHMFGNMTEVEEIISWAKSKNLFVIEDACLALGSSYGGKKAGRFADASIFSFNVGKPITAYGGGLLLTDNQDLINKVRIHYQKLKEDLPFKEKVKLLFSAIVASFLFHPLLYPFTIELPKKIPSFKKLQNPISTKEKDPIKIYSLPGYQLALIYSQFKRITSLIDKRKKLYLLYSTLFKNTPAVTSFTVGKFCSTSPSHFSFLVKNKVIKNKLIEKALEKGIRIGTVFDYVCPLTPSYKINRQFPEAQFVAEHIVNIPFYPDLNHQKATEVAEKIKDILKTS